VEERAGHRPDCDEASSGGERQGMAREVFSLLRHTIKTIKECEWPSGGLAMLRNNHLSLLPTDFKVMIREDGCHGERCNTVEEVERERSRWMRGSWAAVAVFEKSRPGSEPIAASAGLVYGEPRPSVPRPMSDIRAMPFDFTSAKSVPDRTDGCIK
jgi:hypothetical protein